MDIFTVITADIINSREVKNIAQVLKPNIYSINFKSMCTPFEISRGDELQTVCKGIDNIPVIIRHLRYYCRPFKLRVGVGVGDIDSLGNTMSSWNINGEAFYRARKGLDRLKKIKRPSTIVVTDNYYYDISINTIYRLADSIMDGWTKSQWDAVQTYEKELTYENAAKVLNISKQSVNKSCHAAKWLTIRDAEKNIYTLLRHKFLIHN